MEPNRESEIATEWRQRLAMGVSSWNPIHPPIESPEGGDSISIRIVSTSTVQAAKERARQRFTSILSGDVWTGSHQ